MKKFQVFGASVIVVMAGYSGVASAGWLAGSPYIGGGVSYSIYDGLGDFASDPDEFTTVSTTKNTFGHMLFGGWSLPSGYSIELSYADFGEFDVEEREQFLNDVTLSTDSGNIWGKGIGMRYDWSASGGMNLFGRVGVMRWEAVWDSSQFLNGVATRPTEENNTNGSNFYLGLGGQYEIVHNLFLYTEAQYLEAKFEENGFTSKQPVYSVFGGVMYRFGAIGNSNSTSHGASKNDGRNRDVTACDPKYKEVGGLACE